MGRDRDKSARFARVPTGFETCAFCLMLASRGAVYHSRKAAGEFRHFHRNCDCKVVPSFEDDPEAELVEGVRPRELYERYRVIKQIDSTEDLSASNKEELKERVRFFKSNDKLIEAQRISERTNFDIEMLRETGFCSGIENYSGPLSGRESGSRPMCLMDYFDDFLLIIDESHITIPQIGGCMQATDQGRLHLWITASDCPQPWTTDRLISRSLRTI